MLPFWLKLLRANNNRGGYGLALPFIAGAYLLDSNDDEVTLDSIRSIISSMVLEVPDESYISLTVCDRLKEAVFAESSSFYAPSPNLIQVLTMDGGEGSLYVTPSILDTQDCQIEELSQCLFKKYAAVFKASTFSYRQGKFDVFSIKDHELINQAKSINEEFI